MRNLILEFLLSVGLALAIFAMVAMCVGNLNSELFMIIMTLDNLYLSSLMVLRFRRPTAAPVTFICVLFMMLGTLSFATLDQPRSPQRGLHRFSWVR